MVGRASISVLCFSKDLPRQVSHSGNALPEPLRYTSRISGQSDWIQRSIRSFARSRRTASGSLCERYHSIVLLNPSS